MMERMRNSREELERFKTDINLVEFAESHRFTREKPDRSCATSIRLVRGDEVILIGRSAKDGHWLYHDPKGMDKGGSIVDFAQRRTGKEMNLGEVRKELNAYLGQEPTRRARRPVAPQVTKSSRDQVKLDGERATLRPLEPGHTYLTQERGISKETVKGFQKDLALDRSGEVCFPTYDREGRYCGSDKRRPWDERYKGFTPGGKREGLWQSKVKGAERVVICESAIDCMSYHDMKPDRKTDYISLGGSSLAGKKEQLKHELSKYKEVVIATDKDTAGIKVANDIKGMRKDAKVDHPTLQKDWNQELKMEKGLERAKESIAESKLRRMEQRQTAHEKGRDHGKDRDDGPGMDR